MEWVKLATTFHSDPAIAKAGEAAEVLFVRALAYAGAHETDGFIAKEVLLRLTPTKGPARARALVNAGLWEVVPGGWKFITWAKHQTSRDAIEREREAARKRQARARDKKRSHGSSHAVTDAVSHAQVTGTEVEVEVEVEVEIAAAAAVPADAAAAADAPAPPAVDLPPAVEILRRRLEAAKMVVRWDKLDPGQLSTIAELVELHGDGPLVKHAVAAYQPNRPIAFAQGWIGGWQALPAPGQSLRLLDAPPCTEPGHQGTTRHCAQCASERLAGDR